MPENTVPGAVTTQTVNPAEILSNIFSKNQDDLSKVAQAAATPIPGGHATSLPLTMQTGPRETHPGQLDHREVVGAGNARAQGIGNSVIGVMNLLAGTETALDNKKKLEIASSTQQLLTAQQAYDQAAELYKQDPQNADAKAAMDRNKAVMNGILSNDKIRKAIAKGMNVDFTDPKANDTLEHQAVAQGKGMAKEHLSYADQFNQKTPQVMQPNQQAIAKYQAKLQEQKLNVETMKTLVPFLRAQMAQQTAENQIKGRMDVETFKQGAENARALTKSQDAWDLMKTHVQLSHDARLSEIHAEGSKDIEVLKKKLSLAKDDPTLQEKAYLDFQTKSTTTLTEANKRISDLQMQRSVAAEHKPYDAALISNIDEQLKIAKEVTQGYKDIVDGTSVLKNSSLKKGDSNARKGAGTGSSDGKSGVSQGSPGTLGSASTYLNAPTDSTAEDGSDDDTDVLNF